jgi:shikimate kinase
MKGKKGKKGNNTNIVLIGFMGVGKGRTARMLAEKTGMFAVDCDDLIESYGNTKVKKIFSQFGEPRFRELERKVAHWLEKQVSHTIISTGGGFFNVPNIRKIGTVVYLHLDFDRILDSIYAHPNMKKKIKKRPLLKDLDKARALLKERLPLYRDIADIEIKIGGRTIEDIADDIIRQAVLK